MKARWGIGAHSALAASLKLSANIALRRDLFALTLLENRVMQTRAGIDRVAWLRPRALRRTVQQLDFGNVVTYADFSRLVRPTREQPTIKFFDEILRQKRPYRDTTLFRSISRGRIKRKRLGLNKSSSVVLTPDNFVQYYDQCMRHAEFIAVHGLQPFQKSTSHRPGRETDIAALIDVSGEVMFFRRGNHRLGIARALRIERIPVRIYVLSGAYLERFMARRDCWVPGRLPSRIHVACQAALEATQSASPPCAANIKS